MSSKVVFVDFGKKGKVFTISDNNDEVVVFDSLNEMIEKLNPTTIVIDNLPSALQIAKNNVTILRIKDLKILAEERKKNGVRKTDENDVRLLKTIFHRSPELFQPLSPEEIEVRAMTELWVELAGLKKTAKRVRTITKNEVAIKAHKTFEKLLDELAKEIHEKALQVPLYRVAVEKLGIKGPTLAYIVAHDGWALASMSRDRLEIRYALYRRPWKGRPLRSRLLILLANVAVINRHPRYQRIYECYRNRKKGHWPAILRVATVLLRDLRKIARTQKAGPPA